MKNIKIVDCTLRDGGYYCDWIYSKSLVQEYLHSMTSTGVNYVEIGLRSNVTNKFLGPFAYCTEDFLKELNIPKELQIGVMLNASEFISNGESQVDVVKKLFIEAKNSHVSLVRIASHLHEVSLMIPIIKTLNNLGYIVGLNVMQVGGKSEEQIRNVINSVKDLKELEVLYFADSLGNMRPEDVNELTKIFKNNWPREIGIHTHDNMGMALSNTLEAVRSGVTWIDGTVLGMGRGAGNVRTEYLLLEAHQRNWGDFHPDAIFSLVQGTFTDLQRQHGWGTNLLYYISAQCKIHPSFVQTLLFEYNYTADRLLEILKKLGSTDSSSYSTKKLSEAMASGDMNTTGDWNPASDINANEVLVLGSGDSVGLHQDAISSYIKSKKLPVISLNINKFISPDNISYFAASHPIRILFDFEKYKKLGKPLIAPSDLIKTNSKLENKDIKLKNLGIKITEGQMSYKDGGVAIPSPLAISYVLSMLSATNVKKINLVGFDGYATGDERNKDVQAVFELFQEKYPGITLTALTPTNFKLKQSSIYANGL